MARTAAAKVAGSGAAWLSNQPPPRCLFKVFHVETRVATAIRSASRALQLARKQGRLERNLDLEHASYFVSRITIRPTPASALQRWRNSLFIVMARNASSPIEHFALPRDRTLIMGADVAL